MRRTGGGANLAKHACAIVVKLALSAAYDDRDFHRCRNGMVEEGRKKDNYRKETTSKNNRPKYLFIDVYTNCANAYEKWTDGDGTEYKEVSTTTLPGQYWDYKCLGYYSGRRGSHQGNWLNPLE